MNQNPNNFILNELRSDLHSVIDLYEYKGTKAENDQIQVIMYLLEQVKEKLKND